MPLQAGRPEQTFYLSSKLSAIAFSPVGKKLAAADTDGKAMIWEDKAQINERPTGLEQDGNLRIWELNTPRVLVAPEELGSLTRFRSAPMEIALRLRIKKIPHSFGILRRARSCSTWKVGATPDNRKTTHHLCLGDCLDPEL